MKEKLRKALTIILMVVFVSSTAMMIYQNMNYQDGDEAYSAAQDISGLNTQSSSQTPEQDLLLKEEAEPSTEEETDNVIVEEILQEQTEEVPVPEIWIPAVVEDDPEMESLRQTDLAALREVNEDVVGWISIPGTVINYPIMQGEDNEYYLHYTWDGKKSTVGAIFMECTNTSDFSDFHTIIYGHHLKSKKMFSAIRNYKRKEYWEAHPYIYIVTDADVYRYEIYASYEAEVDGDTYRLGFREGGKRVFLELGLEKTVIDTGVIPEVTDKFLTLSTCTGGGYATRWVVQARLPMIKQNDSDR